MSVAATRWQQDAHLQPTNPYQRVRILQAYPGDGGYRAFGWSPKPLDDGFKLMSPAGTLGAPIIPGATGIVKVVGAVLGIALGGFLAKKNLE